MEPNQLTVYWVTSMTASPRLLELLVFTLVRRLMLISVGAAKLMVD